MKKKKVIATITIIIAVGLLVAGGILIYQNYSNKNRIVTSFNELKTALEETFNLNSNEEVRTIKETAIGRTTFTINPIFGSSEDGTDVIIGNLNNSTFNYEYRIDEEAKKMYLDSSLLLGTTEMMGINFYQTEDISYIFLRNIFDKYIMIEDNDIFSYLEQNDISKENIDYIYNKVIESIGNNITNDDIKVTNEDGNKKISLELDEERLNELSNKIVEDLKNDSKAKEILGSNIDNLDTTSASDTTNTDSSITYSIYLNKSDIVTYEFNLYDGSSNYSIAFNNGDEKSIVLTQDDEEVLKGIITNNNGGMTIDLSSNNTNVGTLSINNNNINFTMIIEESSNTTLNAIITSDNSNDVITTALSMNIASNGTTIDILEVNDTKQITTGTADFSNINTTNNISVNSLTEEDITNIENNLMIILYNYFGLNLGM